MTPRTRSRSLAIAVGICLASASAWAQTNQVDFDSQPGDFVGGGQRITYTAGGFSVTGGGTQAIQVSFHTDAWDHWWDLVFSAPQGQVLGVGMYEGARRSPFQSPMRPGLDVSGDGRGCNTLTGRFLVLDASYAANGDVLAFAADFEQHCEGQAPALYGAIRFNSNLPVVPRLSVGDAALREGPGVTPMTFTISLSEPALAPVTVDYTTADGTAAAGTDYAATSGTVTFAPSQTSQQVTVPVMNDGAAQGDQYFHVSLANPSGAVLGSSPGRGTIVDGDGPQTFLILDSQPNEYIGQGQRQELTTVDGLFSADSTVHVHFSGDTSWDLYFAAPGNGPVLPGMYEGAATWPSQSATHPGLSVSGGGRSCGIAGRFVVLEASYAPNGDVLSFAADFEQRCLSLTPALYGSIRFNSSVPVVPRLSISDAAVIEGPSQTPMTFTISLSEPASAPVIVDYATADGTALAGSDYTATSGTVTFAPSETSKQVTVQVLNDGAAQGNQYFLVNLANPSGAVLGSSPGKGTIVDGDGPQTFLVLNSQPRDPIGEGRWQELTTLDGVFTVSPTPDHGVHVYFRSETWWELYFAPQADAALVPGAYEGAVRWPSQLPTHPGLSVFGDGRSCQTLTGRFLVLEVSHAPNGDVLSFAADFEQHCGQPEALYGAIRFNSSLPVVPRLTVTDSAVLEGPSQTPMTFMISLSEPSSGPATVDYATADGTAVAGSDYVPTAGTVTFMPSETSKQVIVQVVNDGAAQGDQYFYLGLANPAGATLASSQGRGTITDGDGRRMLLVLDSQPGDWIGQGQAQQLTALDGAFTASHSLGVDVHFVGSPSWELDFAAPGNIPLVPAMYEGAVLRGPFDPAIHPGLGVFTAGRVCSTATGRFLVLEASYAPNGDVEAFAADFEQHCNGAVPALYGAIRFNSNLPVIPRVSVSSATLIETPSPTPMAFTVSLSGPVSGPVTVDYATADGTAVSGSNYVATSGTLTFVPSETSQQVTVQVLDDGVAQGDKYFYVNLANAGGAILGSSQGRGTIVDGDGPQTLLALAGQGWSQRLTILDGTFGALGTPQHVQVDFTGYSWWDLHFAPPANAEIVPGMYEGAARYPFQSPTHPGLDVSGNGAGCNTLTGRFLVLEASYGPSGDLRSFAADFEQHCDGTGPALYGAVRFNSLAPVVPRLSVGDAGVVEGPSQTPMTFTVSLSGPVDFPVTVDYATADGTALAGSDYVATSGTVTFTPGETAKPIAVPVLNDGAAEGDEYFDLNLANPSGAILGSSQGKGTIVDGDGPQTFLLLNSQPGDWIGQGLLQKLTVLDGTFTADAFTPDWTVDFGFSGDTSWTAFFRAPQNAPVIPGTYEGAGPWPFQSPDHPALSVSGAGRGCSPTGRFVVLEAAYGGRGEVERFAANFEQHCDGRTPALYGAVRYKSKPGPSADVAASALSAAGAVGLGQPLAYTFAVTNNGPDPVVGATVTLFSNLAPTGLTWRCAASGGATCGSGGTGGLVDVVDIPMRGIVTYFVEAQATQLGPAAATLCVAAPGGILEWNASNDCGQAATAVLSVSHGDFDGDGLSDILWQKPSTREMSVWYMQGYTLRNAAALARLPVGWSVVGVGDFIRDGLADVLLRQTSTGMLQVWNLSGSLVPTNPGGRGPQLEVVGVGDFDGDRRPDVLWRDRISGVLSVWLMDGLNLRVEAPLSLTRYAWSWLVSAIADLDGDGQADLVMQRPGDDHILVCFLKGLKVVRQAFVYPGIPSGYRLVAAGDYDGNGRDDLVWQHQRTGELLVWYMKGNVVTATAVTTPATHAGTGWKVVGPR